MNIEKEMLKKWLKVFLRLLFLIVLVFIIAIVLWKIFGSGINEEIINENISESNLNLRIENALVEGENLIVDVKREQGFGVMNGVKFVISDGNSSIVLERFANIEERGSQQFAFNLSELDLGEIKSVEIIPLVESDVEEEIYNESVDRITSEEVDLGSGSRIVEMVEEVNETEEVVEEEKSSISSGGGSSRSSSSSGDFGEEESEINYSFFVSNKMALYEDVGQNKTSSEIRDYINNNFEVENITRDLILSPYEVYYLKKGTEADLLRMVFYILSLNHYTGMVLVYESEGEQKFVLNFRDTDVPKYFYFGEGIMEIGIHGWSFNDLMFAEEERRNVLIDRFGIFIERDLRSKENLTINDVQEWSNLE